MVFAVVTGINGPLYIGSEISSQPDPTEIATNPNTTRTNPTRLFPYDDSYYDC